MKQNNRIRLKVDHMYMLIIVADLIYHTLIFLSIQIILTP